MADSHFGQELFGTGYFQSDPFGTIPFWYQPLSVPGLFQNQSFLVSSLFSTMSFSVSTLFDIKLPNQVHKKNLVSKRVGAETDLVSKRDNTEKVWYQKGMVAKRDST